MNYCWIIPIIVGLLSALLGYLLGRLSASSKVKECKAKYEKELKKIRESEVRLQRELDECHREKEQAVMFLFDGNKAKEVLGKNIKENDLTVIEGIGPKIEELFHSFNIKTWKALSETSVERCREILDTKGDSYRIHNPGTWPKQARMAYEGNWKELIDWQDLLKGGIEE